MDQRHTEMRRRLDEFAKSGLVSRIPDKEIQSVINQAKETIYKALAGQRGPRCEIPTGASRSGKPRYCRSPATQACHSGQKCLLEALSEPEPKDSKTVPDGDRSNYVVLDVFSKDPMYWQNEVLKADFPWNLEQVRLQRVRPPSASTRPFACNRHDNDTFATFEQSGLGLPKLRHAVSFDGSDPSKEHLDDQLFRIGLRNLLFHHNLVGSIKDALLLPATGSKLMRTEIHKRMNRSQLLTVSPAHQVLAVHKFQYDRRLLGVSRFELVHHLIPLVTAVAATIADYFVEDGRENDFDHLALTLWPTDAAKREHWLIISHPDSIGPTTQSVVDRLIKEAVESQDDETTMVSWIVDTLRRSKNAYVKPSDYYGLPEWARRKIEEAPAEDAIEIWSRWLDETEKSANSTERRNPVRERRKRQR